MNGYSLEWLPEAENDLADNRLAEQPRISLGETVMPDRPKMPVPTGEWTPEDLCEQIREWALSQGYEYQSGPHASEFGKVIVRDPDGGQTVTIVPNPHHGRRLKKHQVRYTVKGINQNWEE